MKKPLLLPAYILISLSSTMALAEDTLSANFGVTSNYIWRGVTQSDYKVSVSAGADYSNGAGFYLGTWAASVDFNDDTNFEYDIYGGFQTEINNINFLSGFMFEKPEE